MKLNSLIWLTWRQHRWAISGLSVVALIAIWNLWSIEAITFAESLMPIGGFYALIVQVGFGALVGAFWGAPLIARELEERTYFVAWGQDVTPVQWLRGKLIVLGGLAVLLAALIGGGDGYFGSVRTWNSFEANSLVQVGYAALGLSIGVLMGLLSRNVVTAIAVTTVLFVAVRVVLSVFVRSFYWPPARVIARWEDTAVVPERGLELGHGYAGADLEPVSSLGACLTAINETNCMRRTNAAIGTYVEYQPIERMVWFQIAEFVVCALITAALLFVVFRLMSNGGGWKPSRAHRRLGPPVPEPQPVPEAGSPTETETEAMAESAPEPAVDEAPDPDSDPAPGPDPDPDADPAQVTQESATAKTEG
ncbi:hypothetical protein ACSHWB_09250 [Lentzea sp. HUAS TT2]|uniref:hypothetical protein n=1 Tax=Lentzea sp. HUAS TT2 TaxID=3447454 RepID=UPI003F7312B6